ncbi:hypothetical protein K440DRAFT_553315 [Wilcoxina mikolae CBS 423.85]|nr:hypothetical protein K440DRAFT_553315 [Wilcoxina mikolae CBS 423.85]
MFLRRRLFPFVLFAAVIYLLKRRIFSPPPPPNYELTIETAYAHYGFSRGISTFQPDGLSKHLVLPCTPNDDISWLSTLPQWLNLTPKVYHVPLTNSSAPPPGTLTVPKNKGNEVMTYLTYILEHYSDLPDLIVFIHASVSTWHNNDLHIFTTPLMLRELNYRRAKQRGYMNLRCHWSPGCPGWIKPLTGIYNEIKGEEFYLGQVFKYLFPGVAIPEVFGATCCAQFVVTRERIRANSLEEYKRWRDWLMTTELPDKYSGRVMEYLWHYIFSDRQSIDCPKEHVCYCDGYGVCFGSEAAYQAHMAVGKETAVLEQRLQAAVDQGPREGEDLKLRWEGMQELSADIEDKKRRLEREIDVARQRGRDPKARKNEVGNTEFSG